MDKWSSTIHGSWEGRYFCVVHTKCQYEYILLLFIFFTNCEYIFYCLDYMADYWDIISNKHYRSRAKAINFQPSFHPKPLKFPYSQINYFPPTNKINLPQLHCQHILNSIQIVLLHHVESEEFAHIRRGTSYCLICKQNWNWFVFYCNCGHGSRLNYY
jgi:hypothetical protein